MPRKETYITTELGPTISYLARQDRKPISSEKDLDFALLHAARVAKTRGFSHFAILDESSLSNGYPIERARVETSPSEPLNGLIVEYFVDRPKRIFVFKAADLEKVVREKYRML
jgi:hypothetical protein